MKIDLRDILIIVPVSVLLMFGIIMVTSSSIYIADDLTSNPFHFAQRQVIFIAVGFLAMIFFLVIPSELLYKADWIFMLISILLLALLFVPDVGTSVNGSIRWIRLGPINIQPSEICKFSLILYISGYSVRRMTEINSLRSFLKPLFLLFLISILIMGQPDLGSTAIICILVVGILFYAGISFFQLFLLLLLYIFLVNSSSEKLYSKFIYSIASDFHYHIIYFNLKDLLITNLYKMLYYFLRYLSENE